MSSNQRVNNQLFEYPPQFFSGADVTVKMTDRNKTLQEIKIQSLGIVINATAVPLFNYDSPTATKIWVGARSVSGSFAILRRSSQQFIDKLYGGMNNEILSSTFITNDPNTDLSVDWKTELTNAKTKKDIDNLKLRYDNPFSKIVNNNNTSDGTPVLLSSKEGALSFDIQVSFGENNAWFSLYKQNVQKLIIKDCSIQQHSLILNPDAQPLADSYSFIGIDVLFI